MRPWLIWHDEPWMMHGGALSHWEIDGKVMFEDYPHIRESVLAGWERALEAAHFPIPRQVVSIPEGGNCWAEAFAERINVPWGLVEDWEPGDGTTIIVDDVVTTGGSINDARQMMRKKSGSSGYPVLVVVRRVPFLVAGSWADLFGLVK